MMVKHEDVEHAVTHARQVAAYYKQLPAPLSSKKTADGLLVICREYIKKQVRIFPIELARPVKHIRAAYMATPDGYEVHVVRDQDPLWREFAACKELFHVVLDDPETENCRSVKLFEHVQDIVETMVPLDGEPPPAVEMEILAEIAAMEFLFPLSDRQQILKGGTFDCNVIANQYSLPPSLVDRYLGAQYMELLGSFPEHPSA